MRRRVFALRSRSLERDARPDAVAARLARGAGMTTRLALVLLLLLRAREAEALMAPELCYVLDAILFLYGIVLTVLYCHLKVRVQRASRGGSKAEREQKGEPVYTGLNTESQEMYETLQHKSS